MVGFARKFCVVSMPKDAAAGRKSRLEEEKVHVVWHELIGDGRGIRCPTNEMLKTSQMTFLHK